MDGLRFLCSINEAVQDIDDVGLAGYAILKSQLDSGQNDATLGAFPSPIDGSLLLSEQYVSDAGAPRGDLPGSRYCPQTGAWVSFKMFDTLLQGGMKFITSTPSSYSSSTVLSMPIIMSPAITMKAT